MGHPSNIFRPVKRGRKIVRQQYNAVARIAQKVSGIIGEEGFDSADFAVTKRGLSLHDRFVEVVDSESGDARVLHYDKDWVRTENHEVRLDISAGIVLPKGEQLWAKFHQQSGLWVPCSIPTIRFELKDELVKNGSARAHLIEWNGTLYAINNSFFFSVYDGIATFEGSGRDAAGSGEVGDRGYARWASDRQVYEVLQLSCGE